MVEKEFMTKINGAFVDISDSTGVEYKSVLMTNGSSLDSDIVDTLKANLDYIQIAADGMKETQIIDNIKFLPANDVDASIRINADKSNAGSALDSLDFLYDSLCDGRYNLEPEHIMLTLRGQAALQPVFHWMNTRRFAQSWRKRLFSVIKLI
ncbi:MAG: hypothetical protein LBG43_06860 [Treponema sp.]|nr:hypothetical protein [Treponema sp.]